MKPKTIVHGSLFSGIGGFDLAAASLGWENAFHCEINPFCNKILQYWFPESAHYEDITKTDFTPWRGRIDVLSGGFPCQPFSLAGQRRGAEDDRYLWPQMLRVIREVRPAWVVGENVAGIATMVQPGEEVEVASGRSLFGEDNAQRVSLRQEFVIETVCHDLEREGYSVQPVVIPACAVGAPHRRDRVWFVAHRTDAGAEAMQREGADGVCAAGAVADTNLYRQRFRTNEQKSFTGGEGTTDNSIDGKQWITAHPQRCRGSEIHHYLQSQQPDGAGTDGIGGERDAAHADGNRHPTREACEGTERIGWRYIPKPSERRNTSERVDGLSGLLQYAPYADSKLSQRRNDIAAQEWEIERQRISKPQYRIQDWRTYPTQSPVCRRDDELSARLDGITFPKWRQESVKAYGNAVVPALVAEIFRAIEETIKQQFNK